MASRPNPSTSLIRAGVVVGAVTFGALTVQPVWALEVTTDPAVAEMAAASPKNSASLDRATAQDKTALEEGLLRFSVTPSGAGSPAGNGPHLDAGLAPVPSLLYFTPRVANFDIGRGTGGGTCKFISPEFAGASCYKYAVGEASDSASGSEPGAGQELSAGLTEGGAIGDGQAIGGRDAFSIGVAYQQRVRDVDLGVSTTVVSGAKGSDGAGAVVPELQSWKLGLSAGYTGFTFSTSYFEDRAKGDGERDLYSGVDGQETFDLGVKYDLGDWAFGVQYSHSELDTLSIGPALGGDQQVDSYEIGGSYLMGQRLSLGAAIQFWKWDEFAGAPTDEERKQDLLFLVGSHLKF
jgi:predicted porin